jgi:metal-sulfur cluster biosynthetic enzyme
MSMRKFLKQVGVTSQQAIEEALRDVENGEYEIQAEISIASLGMVHKVSGTIKRGED